MRYFCPRDCPWPAGECQGREAVGGLYKGNSHNDGYETGYDKEDVDGLKDGRLKEDKAII